MAQRMISRYTEGVIGRVSENLAYKINNKKRFLR